jgi:hypothetical protein
LESPWGGEILGVLGEFGGILAEFWTMFYGNSLFLMNKFLPFSGV